METQNNMSYAQAMLCGLLEKRQLRHWCEINGLSLNLHVRLFKIASGRNLPTYRLMCETCHLIAPIDWLYLVGETLSYERQTVPQFDCNTVSKFLNDYFYSWQELAKKLQYSEVTIYRVIVAKNTRPSLDFMRCACKVANPIDFFITSKILVEGAFVPERGDIISLNNNIGVVLSTKEYNETHKSYISCTIKEHDEGELYLSGSVKGFLNIHNIATYKLGQTRPYLIEKAPYDTIKKALILLKTTFD